jgi:hypothetical protein
MGLLHSASHWLRMFIAFASFLLNLLVHELSEFYRSSDSRLFSENAGKATHSLLA